MKRVFFLFLLFAAASTARAQITDPDTTQKNYPPFPKINFDTLRSVTSDTSFNDSLAGQAMTQSSMNQSNDSLAGQAIVNRSNLRSPGGALLRSLAVPGWGQLYNKKYFKAVVVAVGQGVLLGTAIAEWKRASNAKKDLDLADYRFHTNNRNLFLWLYAGATVFSMLDAYIDAHLSQDTGEGVPKIGNFLLEPDIQKQAVLLKFSVAF